MTRSPQFEWLAAPLPFGVERIAPPVKPRGCLAEVFTDIAIFVLAHYSPDCGQRNGNPVPRLQSAAVYGLYLQYIYTFIACKPTTAHALLLHTASIEWLTEAAVVTGAQLPGCDPVLPADRRHVRRRLCLDDHYLSTMVRHLFAQIYRTDVLPVPLPEMLDWDDELPGAPWLGGRA